MFYFSSDPLKKSVDSKYSEIVPLINKDNSDTLTHDFESSTVLKGMTSKVTFESLMTQTSVPSSPKTKDQCVMAQIDFKDQTNWSDNIHASNAKRQERESLRPRISLPQEGIGPSARYSVSNKSSIRDLVQNHKSTRRRKSKTQNRARKALRTITFILGMLIINALFSIERVRSIKNAFGKYSRRIRNFHCLTMYFIRNQFNWVFSRPMTIPSQLIELELIY